MDLAEFCSNLFTTGQITLPGHLQVFTPREVAHAANLLGDYHASQALKMPAKAPAFDEEAAMWGAKFMYRSMQLLLLRELGELEIETHLPQFAGEQTLEATYSADLTLRHLPRLFSFAAGLAPQDPLVEKLKQIAVAWPFSSVGIGIPVAELLGQLLSEHSLRTEYCDRIIAARDIARATHPETKELLITALGAHIDYFWPDFGLTTTLAQDGN